MNDPAARVVTDRQTDNTQASTVQSSSSKFIWPDQQGISTGALAQDTKRGGKNSYNKNKSINTTKTNIMNC